MIKEKLSLLRELVECPNSDCKQNGTLVSNGCGGHGPMAKCPACGKKTSGGRLAAFLQSYETSHSAEDGFVVPQIWYRALVAYCM